MSERRRRLYYIEVLSIFVNEFAHNTVGTRAWNRVTQTSSVEPSKTEWAQTVENGLMIYWWYISEHWGVSSTEKIVHCTSCEHQTPWRTPRNFPISNRSLDMKMNHDEHLMIAACLTGWKVSSYISYSCSGAYFVWRKWGRNRTFSFVIFHTFTANLNQIRPILAYKVYQTP